MRKLFIFIALIFMANSLFSQTAPVQHQFNFRGVQKYLSADSSYFQQNKFLLGWHWAGPKRISEAMKANQNDATRSLKSNDLIDSNCNIILKPKGYSHAVGDELFSVRAMQFEPTLIVDSTNPESSIHRIGDSSKSVFGFKHIRGTISNNLNDANYNRLVINNSNLIDSVILSEPWPNNELSLFDGGQWPPPTYTTLDSFLCRTLYFSISLRRLAGCDGLQIQDSILKIELPYTIYQGSNGNIQFQSIPSPYPDSITILSNGRGILRKMVSADPGTREIIITKSMLPQNGEDITISAFFRLYTIDGFDRKNNPELKDGTPESQKAGKIDSLKIKITYLGNCDVAIDWVRFETPHAKEFLSGKFDQYIIDTVQFDLNKFLSNSFFDRGHKLFRYNAIIEGKVFNWIAEKYFNKLIGNINTNEANYVKWPHLYEYYTNAPTKWYGFFRPDNFISAPYSRNKYPFGVYDVNAKTLAIINGYMGYNNGNYETDPSKSHYETYLINKGNPVSITSFMTPPFDLSIYEQVMNTSNNFHRASYLAQIENMVYNSYCKKSTLGFLFSERPWWGQAFIHNGISNDVDSLQTEVKLKNISYLTYRPFSGEELRQIISFPVILGAKGLLYDGPFTINYDPNKFYYYDGEQIPQALRDSIEALPDKEFIESEIAGSDFFRSQNEIFNLSNRFYYLDSIALYLNRPADRIYIGRKSQRIEMNKLHTWIRSIDTTLMNLKLQAWLAKGYARWYQQDPNLSGNIFNSYINESGIRTRSLLSNTYEGTSTYNFRDSSFYDITILRDNKNDSSMTKRAYIGVQNRRTNPLIMENDTLQFYSTAEFDSFVKNGGQSVWGAPHDSIYWRNMYWKRLGAREIELELNMALQKNRVKFDGQLFHVRDLGYDKNIQYDLNLFPWRDERYYDLTDTILTAKSSLAIRFLPGEGKLLEVEKLYVQSPKDTVPTHDPCTVCDSVVNNDAFVFWAQDSDSCCSELYYTYNGTCDFKNFPISIEYVGDINDVSFDSCASDAKYIENKYVFTNVNTWILDSLTHNSSGYLGRLCNNGDKTVFFQVKAGGETKDDSTICLYDHYFRIRDCHVEPANCCDSIPMTFTCADTITPGVGCNHYVTIDNIDPRCEYYGFSVIKYDFGRLVGIDNTLSISHNPDSPIDFANYKRLWKLDKEHYIYCFDYIFLGQDIQDTICKNSVCYDNTDLMPSPDHDPNAPHSQPLMDCFVLNKSSLSFTDELIFNAEPNPLSDETSVTLSLPEGESISIELYDILGEKKMELAAGDYQAGEHKFLLKTNTLASGIYWLRLKTSKEAKSIKLNVIK